MIGSRGGAVRPGPGTAALRAALAAVLLAGLVAAGRPDTPADPPGADDIERARAAEQERADTVGELTARLAGVRAELDGLHAEADRAILAYGDAVERRDDAERRARSARRAADGAATAGDGARRDAVAYAVAAYTGADLSPAVAWTAARGPQEVVDRASYLRLLSGHRGQVLDRADAAGTATGTLARRAAESAAASRAAAGDAEAAKHKALDAVAEQEGAVADILAEQTELELALAAAHDRTDSLERRREQALDRAAAAARDDDRDESRGEDPPPPATATAVGRAPGCTSVRTAGYANGRIPDSALCPLPQTGERLRADAAAAFIELDGAFRSRFGRPMCVADSYRPLHEQVRLFREMAAGMAASPGTSTHGLGIAVDLCGGVNVHGSAEYVWMMAHGPRHDWHNPAWAQNGFEPWHWEYTG
ncbi:D-alanyl-D-alanine carboxypeptidase family protein [Nocardiopsis mangrovi]|uniref:D-alanyl-D-alanine carboxypeptidase family protein n=1 Tax=Nocardiopsis mangrovi TaxID=1179818 RepID=A0ABV9DX41_9ACTN